MYCMWLLLITLVVLIRDSGTAKVNITKGNSTDDTLVLLHVLFRHGDRSPQLKEVYPKYSLDKAEFGDIGFGELTKDGKHREYLIGKALRNKYDAFLGKYEPDAVYAVSTQLIRTKMSCLLALAGLYPPSTEELWDNEILWQPIPCNSVSVSEDKVLGYPLYYCKPFEQIYNNFFSSEEGIKFYQSNAEIYEYLTQNTGWDIKSPSRIYDLYFFLQSMEGMGFELPSWTKDIWPKKVSSLAVEHYYTMTSSPKANRIAAGYFLQNLLKDSENKIQNKTLNNYKIFIYSAHDFNIALLLKALQVFEPHIPPFGSYVTFEVHHIKGVYGFKILYQDYTVSSTEPKVLKLPGCDIFCPVSKFRQLVAEYLPEPNDC